MDKLTIGQRIKLRREESGLSLNQLSEKANVAKSYLSQLENGEISTRPGAEVLFNIADALGTSIADLLGKRTQQPVSSKYPDSLKLFAEKYDLPESDIMMLANVQLRGKRPDTIEDWQYIYESIRRTILGKGK